MRLAAAVAILALAVASQTAEARSAAQKAEFQRHNPCPSTGRRRGACPGYVIDHIDPLCNGGADHSSNMQWQTISDAREKDRWERAICRHKRKHSL